MATTEQIAEMIQELKDQRELSQHMMTQMMGMMLEKQKVEKDEKDEKAASIAKPVETEASKGKLYANNFMSVDKLEKKDQWDEWSWSMKLKIKALNK